MSPPVLSPRRFGSRDELAEAAADHIVRAAEDAISERGSFSIALSGGSTPWAMLAVLAARPVDWRRVHVFQVDERRVAGDDPSRNWTRIEQTLLDAAGVPIENRHPMPVLDEPPDAAARAYAAELVAIAGEPPVLDLVQLGLGSDGHTASLVPGDAALDVGDADVAWSGIYQGHRRMTLTYPALDRARERVWLVAGSDKADAVARLVAADAGIPAGRVRVSGSMLLLV